MIVCIQYLFKSILGENAFIGFQTLLKNFNSNIVKLMPAPIVFVRTALAIDLITQINSAMTGSS